MKKTVIILFVILLSIAFASCKDQDEQTIYRTNVREIDELLIEEQRRSFLYFWETSNSDPDSPGYGLTRDRYPGSPGVASVAAVGYALAAIPIGIENEWITYEEGYERAIGTLETLLSLNRYQGFFLHFLGMETGLRVWNSEVSVIDTALLLGGALFAGQYFGGQIEEKAIEIYDDVDWSWYVDPINRFYMGYDPDAEIFSGAWDGYAEQLMMYVLAAGSNTNPTSDALYRVFKFNVNQRKAGYISHDHPELNTASFYYTYGGQLFTHQYSHAYLDFRNINDRDGVNWFDNAVTATQASYNFAQEFSYKYKSFGVDSWGLSASDGPNGYKAYGSPPATNYHHDGTVAAYAAISSVVYLEEEALNAFHHFMTFESFWGEYGLKASYNLGLHEGYFDESISSKTPYFSDDYVGIDKGITMLMIENYRSDFIWEVFMDIDEIQRGMDVLGFQNR
ncbi:MAG: hypothetical protein IH571_00430 [Acholeplasmataceae bacterium]|nr:hypothetical protein [Acholeplasmataceae bacterium]